MSDQAEQFDSTKSAMLMHLAGELPEAERERMDAEAARDPVLREQLEALRWAQTQVFGALEALDEATPLPVSPHVAKRQISTMLRRWQSGRRFHRAVRWASSLAAAAVILVGVLLWRGGIMSLVSGGGRPEIQTAEATVNETELAAAHLQKSLDAGAPSPAEAHLEALALNEVEKPNYLSESLSSQ